MYRTKNLKTAEYLNAMHLLPYGYCVLDGWYYIGPRTELVKIGCQIICEA